MEKRYFTTAELAERFRTPESTVRYWRHIGYGPKSIRVGRRALYGESEVLRWELVLLEEAGAA